jgi:hypothetical protein
VLAAGWIVGEGHWSRKGGEMKRPLYETPDNLRAEANLAAFIAERWQCQPQKLWQLSQIDYALLREKKLTALAEMKCRMNPKNAYDTYMLSLDKIMAGLRLQEVTDLPVFLVVRWTDATGYLRICKPKFVGIGGRKDRNDRLDTELVGHFDTRSFIIIEENA